MATRRPKSCVSFVVAAFLTTVVNVHAQGASGWGVSSTFVPTWIVFPEAKVVFAEEPISMRGSEFRIGVVRGRDLSGDWGVSFVHRRVRDGSTVGAPSEFTFSSTSGSALSGTQYLLNGVMMRGVEVHKYMPFVTIKQRAQVGIVIAGGVAEFRKTATRLVYDPLIEPDSRSGSFTIRSQPPVQSDVPASEIFLVDKAPIGRVELAGAVIVTPGLKVSVSGGLNFPAYQSVSVRATYLFGQGR
jgi:hypothetical protein